MIFYGTKASALKNGQIINVNCPSCNTNTTMKYSVFGKYAHVYWIPLFPFEKITAGECNSCKKTYLYKELPEEIKIKLDREKEKNGIKFPIWMFSGLFLILGGIGYGFYSSNKTDSDSAEYIKNPMKGDLYYIKLDDGFYSAATVTSTDKDSVYLRFSNLETDQMSSVDDVSKPENFIMGKEGYERKRLKELFEKDTIYTIERN
jgi:hypothetical protein